METISLIPHPDFPPSHVQGVELEIGYDYDFLYLSYRLVGASSVILPYTGEAIRQDGLWQSTCFELFVMSKEADSYAEFNFAPLFRWAAYQFDDYRAGMKPMALAVEPHLLDSRVGERGRDFPRHYQFDATLSRSDLPDGDAWLGLSAVIEEKDGTKSYWALRHPGGKPDFHHRDCFALELPAPTVA